jgi:hypothetical protein
MLVLVGRPGVEPGLFRLKGGSISALPFFLAGGHYDRRVRVVGFEPPTTCFQNRSANQATPHPDIWYS